MTLVEKPDIRSGRIQAVRNNAGLLTEFRRRFIAARGPDRVPFLHNMVTHDIKGLSPGQGKPACLLDRQGKIQASFLVHAKPEELVLEMDDRDLSPALALLKKYRISENVEFGEITGSFRTTALHGPKAGEMLRAIFPGINLPEKNLSAEETPAGFPEILRITRWDLLRIPGYHVWMETDAGTRTERLLLEKGAEPVDRKMFDTLRIEAGVPWPGSEITPSVILNELGNEEMVSFTKGCYVGQEIVARIKYRAHPPRLLKRFRIEGSEPPAVPAPVFAGEKEAGTLTSSCWSPTLQSVIGMGFLTYGTEEKSLAVEYQGTRRAVSPFTPAIGT